MEVEGEGKEGNNDEASQANINPQASCTRRSEVKWVECKSTPTLGCTIWQAISIVPVSAPILIQKVKRALLTAAQLLVVQLQTNTLCWTGPLSDITRGTAPTCRRLV